MAKLVFKLELPGGLKRRWRAFSDKAAKTKMVRRAECYEPGQAGDAQEGDDPETLVKCIYDMPLMHDTHIHGEEVENIKLAKDGLPAEHWFRLAVQQGLAEVVGKTGNEKVFKQVPGTITVISTPKYYHMPEAHQFKRLTNLTVTGLVANSVNTVPHGLGPVVVGQSFSGPDVWNHNPQSNTALYDNQLPDATNFYIGVAASTGTHADLINAEY